MKKIINLPNMLILFCIADILISYLMGLNKIFANLLLISMPIRLMTPLLFIILLIRTVINILKKKPYKKEAIVLLLSFLLFGLILPKAFYLGAYTSLKIANENKVLFEAKNLIESHKAYFKKEKEKKSFPPQKEIPEEELPIAIKKLSPVWVRVYENMVVIKKIGLGDVEGFLISPYRKLDDVRKVSNGIYWITPVNTIKCKN
ncbi:MAG: hypothetical protein WC412_07960 [Candidatus Omnitrophota bacterium]|jgi:hypothetical protein